MRTSPVSLSSETVQFNDVNATKRIGLIALATDLTSEGDFYRQTPKSGVAIHVTRVAFENPTTPENLRKMGPHLTDAAHLLVPVQPLQAICYSCTSASVVIGDAEITRAIQKAVGNVPVVTPTAAARMAFSALGAERIAVLTPYSISTSEPMAAYFAGHGLDVIRFDCLGLEDDRDMALVSDRTIINAAVAADTPDTEALFISCTGLPAIRVIFEIESRIGKPVVTSNQASAWAMTRLSGLEDHKPLEYGRLFGHRLPEHAFEGDA
ncbi:MAG: ectoine utilization protein EutA [Roseibium sp.]